MHANMMVARYKSGENLESAIKGLGDLAPDLKNLPGLQAFYLLRTADDEHVHMGVFDTPENAKNGRENMGPRVLDVITPHLRQDPELRTGEVLVNLPE